MDIEDDIPSSISNSTLPKFKILQQKVAAIRNIVRAQRLFKEASHTRNLIAEYEDERCANYAVDKSAFISSSLNRSKRSIILDRAMSGSHNNATLETDPIKVKQLANDHFKSVAGVPSSAPPTLDEMPDSWNLEYQPLHDVDPMIYNNLLTRPTDEEWSSVISSLPNGSAAGLSGISYELIKNLPDSASKYLRDFVSNCYTSHMIPSHWKDATIYPIPKPYDWNCYLNNTRPITLLDTARKIMTKILNRRLNAILANNNVLKGQNYAGLPGSNCSTPITILETIIHDAKSNNKPLFIFLQDISKAFDSMDTRMLRLAMNRLQIPANFTNLVIDLFTDCHNSVITAYGSSPYYKTEIGIDQGETLSPLLWVIYIDPLLTRLNKTAASPYTISKDPATPDVSTSTLAFMDDTTLISSTIEGLTQMLSTAQEFYSFNNTKINFNKAVLICNRDSHNCSSPLPLVPTSHRFLAHNIDFHSTPLAPDVSFRFLGVWFTLSLNKKFVKKQCKTEYQLFANKLSRKRLTTDQLKYLHNAVLLPKVLYRLKCTALSERDCSIIASPFKRLYKQTSSFVSSLPDSFLHFRLALGIANLYQQHLINHVNTLNNYLTSGTSVSRILQHRLFQIAKDNNIPFSPLLVNNFGAFTNTKYMKTDYIFSVLLFSSTLGISLARPLQASRSVEYTPIYSLFCENPSLYACSLPMIKRSKIQFLHQCTTSDNSILLPYRNAFSRNSTERPGTITPKWYQHIIDQVTHHGSFRITDDFIPSQQTLVTNSNNLSVVPVPERNIRAAFWCATWDDNNNNPILGKAIYTDRASFRFQHWTHVTQLQPGSDNLLTPRSRNLLL